MTSLRAEAGTARMALKRDNGGRPFVDAPTLTTRTHLHLPPELSIADWKYVGEQILLVGDLSAWWLGDWFVFGESHYPERYRHAIFDARLDDGTLRNYARVARKFEVPRRRGALSFHHHAEVAGLTHDEQDYWLALAEERGWSTHKLRLAVRAARRGAQQQTVPAG